MHESKFKDGRVNFRNLGMKGLKHVLMTYANSGDLEQPVHERRFIRALLVRRCIVQYSLIL